MYPVECVYPKPLALPRPLLMTQASAPTLMVLFLCAAALLAPDARAGGKQGNKGGDQGLGLDEAVANLRRGGPGRVLSADTLERDGQRVHRIKILTDEGRVKRYQLDGESGQAIPSGKKGRQR